jgi:hypothetical protein
LAFSERGQKEWRLEPGGSEKFLSSGSIAARSFSQRDAVLWGVLQGAPSEHGFDSQEQAYPLGFWIARGSAFACRADFECERPGAAMCGKNTPAFIPPIFYRADVLFGEHTPDSQDEWFP